MSHLGSSDPCKGEKTQSYVTKHAYIGNNVERFNSHDPESVIVEDVKHRREQEQYRSLSGGSRPSDYASREPMNPASSVSHSAAVPSATAVYPRVALVPRGSGPSSQFETYGLPSHGSPNPSGSHHSTVHSQYRHLMPPHSMLPGQYNNSSSGHISIDMWQKYNPTPWMMPPYEEFRLREREERERAISKERAISQERERERDHERMERQKEERAEKERRDWQEQERLDREERERVQREAVQQHFEESLRLALAKQQQQQKNIGWNPVATTKSSVKGRESSPTINLPPNQPTRGIENERLREREKERLSLPENHEKWIAMMQQQQRNEQSANVSHLQNFAPSESRTIRTSKQEISVMAGHGSSSKISLTPSPISSSASQMKHETNFSLYGYQPFQHTYITHAQLKAREESKASQNIQSIRVAGSNQMSVKSEKDERPLSPGATLLKQASKHQMKVVHSGQERLMFQPLVGSGGAFKPYEYCSNSSSPAPPAHQNTSPALVGRPQYQLQDQPQNLVKGDGKSIQERVNSSHKYESRDKLPVSTSSSLSGCFSPPYSSSKSMSPASNTSLIQQGLVPNPMYIAATHPGSSTPPVSFVHSQASSKAPVHSASPPVSQQYAHVSPNSGIASGVPVCRPNSVPYTLPPGRTNSSYSPSNSLPVNSKIIVTHDHHLSNRPHMSVQSSNHRSPSPAHIYGNQSNPGAPNSPHQSSPRLTNHHVVHLPVTNSMPSSPFHSSSQSESQDIAMMAGVPLVKRKLLNDVVPRKRPKSIDDGLLPPQLQPQVQTSSVEAGDGQTVTPPNLVSNAPVLAECSQGAEAHPAKSDPPSPAISSNSVYKSESIGTPPSMPDLQNTPSVSSEELELNSGTQNYVNLNKYKIPNKVITASSSAEENNETCANICTSEKLLTPSSNISESNDERSTGSPAIPNSNITPTISSNHTKLKKAWLQRHSENEDKKTPSESCTETKLEPVIKIESQDLVNEITMKPDPYVLLESSICDEVLNESKLKICEDSSSDVSENRTNKSDGTVDEDSSSSDSDSDAGSKSSKRKTKVKSKNTPSTSKRSRGGNNSDPCTSDQHSPKKEGKKKGSSDKAGCSKKRGRKKARHAAAEENKKKAAKVVSTGPPEKPSVSQLKKTGEPFLQDGPCHEVAPRLPKCRECRLTQNQRNKKMPNIFCRFFAYRKLRYGKNGTILSAGFSEPSDALPQDFKLWLPPVDHPPGDIEIETSKFLLTYLGDQFCDLVEMEKEAQKMHMAVDGTVTWKRVVQGVREMCDVCETTLFNIHWACHKCGFVVCIDCYKFRKNNEARESLSKDRDGYQWLMCSNRQPHEQEKLLLTQIIAGSSLWDLSNTLHDVRKKWNIPAYCSCAINDNDQENKSSSNGICKLMSAVTKCFSSDKDSSREPNGSDSSRSSKRTGKSSSVNGLLKQEDGLGGYSSESGGSPLSWLADVALNSSSKISDDQKENDDDKSSEDYDSCGDASADSEDDDRSENFSTLRELLIRPTGKMGGKNSGSSSSTQKTLTSTLDEVISCVIEQKVRKADKKSKEKQLLHFTRRYQMTRSGRELPPVRTCYLSESSLLYPEIPHIWLGNGKILLLKEPHHNGNLQLFQEQWKRGQPVVVSDVGTKLNEALWHPDSFIREFGDVKGDFLNCLSGTLLPNQPLKKFWEGFENVNKRMKGEDGETLTLKMLDWPPGDEFSDVMPSRYDDFMQALPLPQYTHREGVLNMASRLPDCFVQPDLGPRMYNAYGISSSLGKGSTNLHLDVSDAINVLAYVATAREGRDETVFDVMKILDESGCDSLMKRRARERGSRPGAIWHVFNARDADKIRDFLNKVSEEQGVKLNPHHDPIHNQEWYLDEKLRTRLFKEYGVEAYSIAQCFGDAIFIPAGSPHQVMNLFSCIIISEDFVSPESVGHSFFLTQEIRNLSENPINLEDKLQIKNIIYHAVKDALALLQSNDPEEPKT